MNVTCEMLNHGTGAAALQVHLGAQATENPKELIMAQVLQHYKYIWERTGGGGRKHVVIVNLQPTPKVK